jgi:hypothetical protein
MLPERDVVSVKALMTARGLASYVREEQSFLDTLGHVGGDRPQLFSTFVLRVMDAVQLLSLDCRDIQCLLDTIDPVYIDFVSTRRNV